MNSALPDRSTGASQANGRQWLATLQLEFTEKHGQTVLSHALHSGPLRVQRPFYPDADGSLHLYLLHPPGGMVLGDQLQITAELNPGARALLTTPSAGKFYSTGDHTAPQLQQAELHVADGAVLEWLPQETLVFSGANAEIRTVIRSSSQSSFCAWDIIALGQPASGQLFVEGRCRQRLEIFRGDVLVFREYNDLTAGAAVLTARWGLQGHNTLGTLVANVTLERDEREALLDMLSAHFGEDHHFYLTQKEVLLIGRYLGPSATAAREGFVAVWEALRPRQLHKPALQPRIWRT